jgi:hypothetical protein
MSLLDGSSRRIGAYVVNLKLICEALRVFYKKPLIFITFYGPKFIENEKILALKCLKDVFRSKFKNCRLHRAEVVYFCGSVQPISLRTLEFGNIKFNSIYYRSLSGTHDSFF